MADDKKDDGKASGILDTLSAWISDNPGVLGALLGGGLGAAAGYSLPNEEDDILPEEDKFRARLKRALLFGGIGAGGGALTGYGINSIFTSVPDNKEKPETKWDRGMQKFMNAWDTVATPGTTAAVGGVAGLKAGNKVMNWMNEKSGLPFFGGGDRMKNFIIETQKLIGDKPISEKTSFPTTQAKAMELLNLRGDPVKGPIIDAKLSELGLGDMARGEAMLKWMGGTRGRVTRGALRTLPGLLAGFLGYKLGDMVFGDADKKK